MKKKQEEKEGHLFLTCLEEEVEEKRCQMTV